MDFLYRWRAAILSKDGPSSPSTRLVLVALGEHMRPDGTGAWPSQALLAKRAGMAPRSVIRHMRNAEKAGWIRRERVAVTGKTWRRTEYVAAIPKLEQGATLAGDDSKHDIRVPLATDQDAIGAKQAANDGSIKMPQWHTNSPSNPPFNSPNKREEGFAIKEKDRAGEQKRRGEVSHLLSLGYSCEEVAKFLHERGVTLEEVRSVFASVPADGRGIG